MKVWGFEDADEWTVEVHAASRTRCPAMCELDETGASVLLVTYHGQHSATVGVPPERVGQLLEAIRQAHEARSQ